MDLFGFCKGTSPEPTVFKDIVARYQHLRPIRLRLNNELVHRLSRDVLNEGAKKIGIYHDGTFVFENEDETSVLMENGNGSCARAWTTSDPTRPR